MTENTVPNRLTSESDVHGRPEVALVTGFPAFTARRMTRKILAADPAAQVLVLCRDKFASSAEQMLGQLPDHERTRATILEGDVCNMDLGLSGPEYRRVAGTVTTIHHMAGIYYLGVDRATTRRVNVLGTRNVLDLAAESVRLRRICHWSTASVSGRRTGVIMEDELDCGQSFHNVYEESKFEAEKLAESAKHSLPLTILRPGILVGDSQTGEIDKLDGPYYLIVLIANNETQLKVPLPGRGNAPLNLVPIDFAIDAGYHLSLDEQAAGHTYHLTDPNPLPARQVYELIAERSHGGRLAKGFLPGGLTRAILRAPGLARLARSQRSFLESFDRLTYYNCREAQRLLEPAGIQCPPLPSYVDNLIHYVRSVTQTSRGHLEDEVFDPFD